MRFVPSVYCVALMVSLTTQAQILANKGDGVSIQITVNKNVIDEGKNIVIDVLLQDGKGQPIAEHIVHAEVNGKEWGAEYSTLPSGVAHILLPLPEQGSNEITVTDGVHTSNALNVQVSPRAFHVVEDPSHLVLMEYETWFGPGYHWWKTEEAMPILGHYSSLDSRVLRQHALWFNDLGINVVETDWTNNLTGPFPTSRASECILATDELFRTYSSMKQHPKIVFLLGPEHNLWRDVRDTYNGPWFSKQLNYIYEHYINRNEYRDLYLRYEGKPLILLYLNGPRVSEPPDIRDTRFTIRYVGAWLQNTHQDKYGVWSWYDQQPTPIYHSGSVEAMTVTSGYPSVHSAAAKMDHWLAQDAGGKNYGETYLSQWEVAMKYRPRFLFINQWNEFSTNDEYNVNMSNDIEPTTLTEKGDKQASGWGFFYYNLTKEMIEEYHRTPGR